MLKIKAVSLVSMKETAKELLFHKTIAPRRLRIRGTFGDTLELIHKSEALINNSNPRIVAKSEEQPGLYRYLSRLCRLDIHQDPTFCWF